ncbi:glycoside hydrolase family 19 protein, partial [Luteimonas abyssi]|uniref:glycoside hydrolase family 19 protein n=1 Tax=Luteimonas abyssi TaxID=1247514 RepID=UPI000ABC9FF0
HGPSNSTVHHLHPIGFIENYSSLSSCACNQPLTEEQLQAITNASQIENGLFSRSAHASIRGTPVSDFLRAINLAMNAYDITECIDKAHFLAHVALETDYIKTTQEYKNRDGSIPAHWHNYSGGHDYHGRGLIQLTHNTNYRAYSRRENNDGTDYDANRGLVASNLQVATDSACWYWRNGSAWGDMSTYAKNNDFIYTAIGVNGGFNHFLERKEFLQELASRLKINLCSIHSDKTFDKFRVSESALHTKPNGMRIFRSARYFGDANEV